MRERCPGLRRRSGGSKVDLDVALPAGEGLRLPAHTSAYECGRRPDHLTRRKRRLTRHKRRLGRHYGRLGRHYGRLARHYGRLGPTRLGDHRHTALESKRA